MLLEKVSIHTEILLVYCYKFFIIFLLFVLFLFVENCILLPKGINEFVAFLCIVLYMNGFDFLSFYPNCYCWSEQKFCFRVHFYFSYKNDASKSFYKGKIHPFPLMLIQRNEMWYTNTLLGI